MYTDTRDLAKLLLESGQEVPECLEQFKPTLSPDTPLFEDDDDDDEEEEEQEAQAAIQPAIVPNVAQGASWDAGDNSVVFQGAYAMGTSRSPLPCSLPFLLLLLCMPIVVSTSIS